MRPEQHCLTLGPKRYSFRCAPLRARRPRQIMRATSFGPAAASKQPWQPLFTHRITDTSPAAALAGRPHSRPQRFSLHLRANELASSRKRLSGQTHAPPGTPRNALEDASARSHLRC